jgi:hypothetical protein
VGGLPSFLPLLYIPVFTLHSKAMPIHFSHLPPPIPLLYIPSNSNSNFQCHFLAIII